MKRIPVSSINAEIFGKRRKEISEFSLKVLEVIREKWPTNPLEVAKMFNEKSSVKTQSAKYLYHFRKLKKLDLIDLKKVGNTYIAWPMDIEKIRVLHEMMK